MGSNWTQAEDFILGMGAKLFTIVGPVIVYGLSTSVVYGLLIVGNGLRAVPVYDYATAFWERFDKVLWYEYTFIIGNVRKKEL